MSVRLTPRGQAVVGVAALLAWVTLVLVLGHLGWAECEHLRATDPAGFVRECGTP